MTLLLYPGVQIADQWCKGRLHFELVRHVRSTLLDGERVVRDLLDWHDRWESVLPTRLPHAVNKQGATQYSPYTELSMGPPVRRESWPADTLSIWTIDEALPHLRQRIEERWEPGEIEMISPDADAERCITYLDNEHDRRLCVWWD